MKKSLCSALLLFIPAIYLGVNWYKKKTSGSEETPQEDNETNPHADKLLSMIVIGALSLFPNHSHAESSLTDTDKQFIAGMCEQKASCISAWSGYFEARLSASHPAVSDALRPDFSIIFRNTAGVTSMPFYGKAEQCERVITEAKTVFVTISCIPAHL